MAEPLAGLLSPDLAQEFSADYVKQIVDADRMTTSLWYIITVEIQQ